MTSGPVRLGASAQQALNEPLTLGGHVPGMLNLARRMADGDDDSGIIVTVVLRREDPIGFSRFLGDLYDPASPKFRKFASAEQLADEFGPSRSTYATLRRYLEQSGLVVIKDSSSRQTITVRGTRADLERAFAVRIVDYEFAGRRFHANVSDPALPPALAAHVEAIAGLSNLARPRPAEISISDAATICSIGAALIGLVYWPVAVVAALCAAVPIADPFGNRKIRVRWAKGPPVVTVDPSPFGANLSPLRSESLRKKGDARVAAFEIAPGVRVATGAGQTIGITSFSDFDADDVRNWLVLMNAEPDQINRLSRVSIGGGSPSRLGQVEPLLDIAGVMSVARDADVVVYDAPFTGAGTSFQALFSAMIDDGVDIISNSWAYCESDTSRADVESIESILQTAAAAGISVFSASGDLGSTCLNGRPDTVHVPSSAPSLTAVGGSRLEFGPGFTYGNESWWDGIGNVPPSGQGGFGLSAFFSRPAYQDGLNDQTMRSLPDVVANADPATGFLLCQAGAGGCPDGKFYGGTSVAAPIWAGFAALLNEANGSNLGFLNPLIYPLANTDAFHDAASMGTDFAHVGLGSPSLDTLHRLLKGIVVGPADAELSEVVQAGSITDGRLGFPLVATPADGVNAAVIVVSLSDNAGHTVSGKSVKLDANSLNALIEPAGAVATDSNGQAAFTVTNLESETVTFTATDMTDGIVLEQTATVTFAVPPVASAGIQAFPTLVDANGVAETKITVTVEDALGRPAPDKQIRIEQGAGNSVIRAPDPALTDADGQIEFTATNLLSETITYTAHVVSDDDLPVPGSAEVEFQNGLGGCFNQNPPPAGLNGWSVEPFITGFDTGPLFFGNVNFGNCVGAYLPTFRGDGAFISNFRSGDLFGLGLDGGAAVTPMINHGPTLAVEAVGLDGRLYARRVATTGNFTTGAIFELDPDSGEILRTVAANVTCPHHLVVDPLSGDLFFDNNCTGAGSDDPSVYRIRNPAGPAPLLEQYAVLPGTPNGLLAFAPDGELFVAVLSPQPAIVRISGTDGPQPPAMTTIADLPGIFWLAVAEADENGTASKLAVMLLDEDNQGVTNLADITVEPPTLEPIVAGIGPGLVGPDGCLYGTLQHTVYRFRDPLGGCSFLASGASPMLRLTLDSGLPPVQGAVAGIVATLSNVDPAADFALLFRTRGANNQVLMERTDTDGRALLRYTGINAGLDRIGAEVTLPDGARVVSNQVELDWAPGQASSALSLNETPSGTLAGLLLTVRASLVDVSRIPPAPIGGAVLEFEMDGESCAAITNNLGRAECELPAANIGVFELVAMFAGQPGSGPAEDRLLIFVMDPAGIDVLFRDSFELLVQPR